MNPPVGVIRNDTSEIALWMIDSDHDEESFFVPALLLLRQRYYDDEARKIFEIES